MENLSTITVWNMLSQHILHFIRTRVKDRDDADDVLQEVFMKVHRHIDQLKDEQKLTSWVFGITRNVINDYYRHQKYTAEELNERIIEEESQTPEWSEQFEKCLTHMIDDLPEKYREAIILSEIKSHNQHDVADQLALSYSGAKSRVQRGRAMLKESFKECCNIEINKNGQFVSGDPEMENCRKC